MSNKELTINVIGSAGTGKSTIAYLIADFVSHTGFEDVNVNLLDGAEETLEHNFEDKLQYLQDSGLKIVVNEVQALRENGL